ncbi:Uncharacterised protein [Prevotella intermedia]|nr:Uncharacterised protein [Prevotella intermedia]
MLSLPHGQGARTSLVGYFVNMRKPPWQIDADSERVKHYVIF